MKEIFYDFCGYNTSIFLVVNNMTQISFLQMALKYLSGLFNITNFGVVYLLLCLYQYIRVRKLASSLRKVEYYRIFDLFVYAGVCYAIFGFTFALLKFSVNLPRPCCSLDKSLFYSTMDFSSERCLSAFPSAHTGLAVMVSILLWPYLGRVSRVFAFIVPILVAISRMSLAMHYPADLLYSVVAVIFVMYFSKLICGFFNDNLMKYFRDKFWNVLFEKN